VEVRSRQRYAVAASAGFDGQFSWSNEGRRLAFISDRDGIDAVYVVELPDGNAQRCTTSSSLNPAWFP